MGELIASHKLFGPDGDLSPLKLFQKDEKKKPAKRTLIEEGNRTLDAKEALYGRQLAYDARSYNDYSQLTGDAYNRLLQSTGRVADEEARRSATLQRESDIADVELLGGRAIQAFRDANPDLADYLDLINEQSVEELRAGGELSSSERREVVQAGLGDASLRGFGHSPADAYMTYAGLGAAGEARKARRRAYGSEVANQNFAMANVPFMSILGRPVASLGPSSNAVGSAFGAGGQSAPNSDPFNAYAQDLNNTNYNAEWSERFSVRNYNAAITSALIGAIGNAAGGAAAAGACWVARAVFGLGDPRWILFREWIKRHPVLFTLYCWVGPWLALQLPTRPKLTSLLRRLMCRAIQ
jgi:hypothetical protein